MRQSSTLKELSEILNLSISTVSRALKDHPDISEESKKRVRELAMALEYEPNAYAIQLRTNESKVLGILVPSVANFFYDSFISAVEEEARSTGYSVFIMQSGDDAEVELTSLKLLKRNRVTGLFVAITTDTNDLSPFLKLNELNIPLVFFDRVPDYDNCNKICLADRAAAAIAAEELIKKNKKRVIALFGHPNLTISQKRYESFKETYGRLSPDAVVEYGFPLNTEEGRQQTMAAIESSNPPDAVFCMGDLILIGAMQAIYEKGLIVPHDISVISISNGFIPTLYNPKITYVETSGYKLGKLAFKRMISCIAGDKSIQEFTIDSILVQGGSL